jgi:hypothetical protein
LFYQSRVFDFGYGRTSIQLLVNHEHLLGI